MNQNSRQQEPSPIKLSVCIPVYKQNVVSLVHSLDHQLTKAALEYEIRVYDDGSGGDLKAENRDLAGMHRVFYQELPENAGRAAIRNQLADDSSGSHLLFLDGDSVIEHEDFISKYITLIQSEPLTVWCGGTYYLSAAPDRSHMLHWTYGNKIVSRKHSKASSSGYFHFMSSNFVISRTIFHEIRFDEGFRLYGHEDTLFGARLSRAHIPVKGTDNGVLHQELDTNEVFLIKTRQSIENLHALLHKKDYRPYMGSNRLVSTGIRLRKVFLDHFFVKWMESREQKVLRRLLGEKPSLRTLNMYKLYLFLKN